METKKILIAEPSVEFCCRLEDCIAGAYSLRVCSNGTEALRLLEEFRPDVLVMDLVLPELDGIALLKYMALQSQRPRVLLTTCVFSPYVEAVVGSYGIDLLMVRPCEACVIADRICDLAQEKPVQPVLRKGTDIADVLLTLGLSPKRKAYQYLQLCIELYGKNPCQAVTKKLYPAVAEAFDTNPVALERAIRQGIHEAWACREDTIWRLYFSADRNGNIPRPTNTDFISRLADAQRRAAQ